MAFSQGFRSSDGKLYVYQENTDTNSISAAMGIDDSGTGNWFLNLSSSAGAEPGVGFQPIAIDVINKDK